jgi:hypothetical protein
VGLLLRGGLRRRLAALEFGHSSLQLAALRVDAVDVALGPVALLLVGLACGFLFGGLLLGGRFGRLRGRGLRPESGSVGLRVLGGGGHDIARTAGGGVLGHCILTGSGEAAPVRAG